MITSRLIHVAAKAPLPFKLTSFYPSHLISLWSHLPLTEKLYSSLVTQRLKRLPAMQETWVRSLGREDPLEKEMATHSSILAWESHGRRSLESYSPWGRKESDTTATSLHRGYFICFCGLSHLVTSDTATPWTVGNPRLLCPWGFSRQEYWNGLPFPSPRDLLDPGIEPRSPAWQADSLPSELYT